MPRPSERAGAAGGLPATRVGEGPLRQLPKGVLTSSPTTSTNSGAHMPLATGPSLVRSPKAIKQLEFCGGGHRPKQFTRTFPSSPWAEVLWEGRPRKTERVPSERKVWRHSPGPRRSKPPASLLTEKSGNNPWL